MKKFMPFKKTSAPPADDASYEAPPPAYDANPYAQAPASNDPYAKPGPPPRVPTGGSTGSGPAQNRYNSPAPSGGSGGGGGGGYGADRYGASGGYGSNRYDNDAPRAGARGPGGYGGLGRTNSGGPDGDDGGRNDLFAGARERVQQQQQQQPQDAGRPAPRAGNDDNSGGRGDLFGGARERYEASQRQPPRRGGDDDDDYGGYGAPRQMTAEEEEEQEVADTKARIKELKQESAASSARSLAAGQAALEVSRATMARLGAQGERLYNTEKNLDLAASHNKVASDQTAKLKSLNRSMFAVHVNNPFTAASKEERRREELLAEHQAQRAQREETRRLGNQGNARVEQALRDMTISNDDRPQFQRNLAARSKYQFEDDEEDDEAEDQIEQNIAGLEDVTKGLHQASLAIGRELDQQNRLIDRIGKKSDLVDDGVRLNRDRLARIR
jgi:hypothetical protein